MSRTEYGRPHLLRLDDAERHALALAVMRDIELTSAKQSPVGADELHLRHLRSLLERLTD